MTEQNPNPPPGWYPHPNGQGGQAYWDGTAWSVTAPAGPAASVPSAPMASAAPIEQPGKGLAITSIVLGVLALVLCPIVLGPVSIWCGYKAKAGGHPLGQVGMIVGIVGLIGGTVLGIIYLTSMR